MVKERMQYARSIQTANHYLGRLTAILDDVMADPECAPSGAVDDGPRGTCVFVVDSLSTYVW